MKQIQLIANRIARIKADTDLRVTVTISGDQLVVNVNDPQKIERAFHILGINDGWDVHNLLGNILQDRVMHNRERNIKI